MMGQRIMGTNELLSSSRSLAMAKNIWHGFLPPSYSLTLLMVTVNFLSSYEYQKSVTKCHVG